MSACNISYSCKTCSMFMHEKVVTYCSMVGTTCIEHTILLKHVHENVVTYCSIWLEIALLSPAHLSPLTATAAILHFLLEFYILI